MSSPSGPGGVREVACIHCWDAKLLNVGGLNERLCPFCRGLPNKKATSNELTKEQAQAELDAIDLSDRNTQDEPLHQHDLDCPCDVCHEARVRLRYRELCDDAYMKGTNVTYHGKPMQWPTEEEIEVDAEMKIKAMHEAWDANQFGPPDLEDTEDPWKHRSKGMVCATCMWYVLKGAGQSQADPTKKQLGRCRRHAPTMNGYPAVFMNDWCGDHKLDETKI